jgi:acyl-CoA synthetase (AMP-forming)/AMP-acid ligase II
MANHQAMVVDPETGRPLGPGQTGEIWMRGPNQMKGYLNNPEATAATLDPDGWIHSGDLGYADEDGYFYVVDRLKELIKYKAYQVAPAELEALLLTHPDVADVGVVRYPDEDAGEVPKAFVVARAPIDADELMAWVAKRVAPYKKVRIVEFIDVIPKSASGKILRRELIARDRQPAPALV